MFRLVFAVYFLCVLTFTSKGQLEVPLFSEPALIEQHVVNTNFSIIYERPKANDRVIFGDLVPDNQVWRTGASECTKIKFDKDVYIDLKPTMVLWIVILQQMISP